MAEEDCMCIGLSIQRPEAAIADPSRLIVSDIYPTYVSGHSFLDAAKFKITSAGQAAHGGFDPKKAGKDGAEIMPGIGREKITGVLPLYLFKEHWSIAKRTLQPLFGFMCCLDVLGYSSEQQFTVPFLVLLKALEKVKKSPTESN